MESYEPGPQERYLVAKMSESEKKLIESLAKLTEKMDALETKVNTFTGDLGAVGAKVDLAMSSITLVQQEQVKISNSMKGSMGIPAPVRDSGVIGVPPGASSASSTSASAPAPPPPPQMPSFPNYQPLPQQRGQV